MSRFQHWLATATFTAIGAFVIATLPSGAPGFGTGAAVAKDIYTCMTDDGYGRYRPCSAGYKAANANWRAGDNCFTDEGYGRYRPCSAGYKAKHTKK
jgi:hypothetical protein